MTTRLMSRVGSLALCALVLSSGACQRSAEPAKTSALPQDAKALARQSLAQLDGSLKVVGLQQPVDVLRDERGVPQIYADTPDDLFFAQGYVHAQDRFYEMDFRRHITSGRLSEMFGTSQIDTDKFLRVSGWRRVAERELPMLSAETRRNLDGYLAAAGQRWDELRKSAPPSETAP